MSQAASDRGAEGETGKPAGNWRWFRLLAGLATIVGLALVVIAYNGHRGPEWRSPLWLDLLCLGGACTLVGGSAWTHTRGLRWLKTKFLGMLGFAIGGALGVLAGMQAEGSGGRWEVEFYAILGGFWVGAILFAWLGIWWGKTLTRRLSA